MSGSMSSGSRILSRSTWPIQQRPLQRAVFSNGWRRLHLAGRRSSVPITGITWESWPRCRVLGPRPRLLHPLSQSRRENVTPTLIPPPKQRRVASQARVSTQTESSSTRPHNSHVYGSVATCRNATCPSPRYERFVAVCIPITPPSSSPNIHVTPIQ
jgi:predicted component of type VI protein secretion system